MRKIGKSLGTNRGLATHLWASELHEARLLAVLIVNADALRVGGFAYHKQTVSLAAKLCKSPKAGWGWQGCDERFVMKIKT